MQLKQLKTIDIEAKEWRDKIYGNSYFSSDVALNYGMNNQKVILDAYTNFKIRKQDYLDKQVNPASSFADNFYIDGSVNPSTFQKYLNFSKRKKICCR